MVEPFIAGTLNAVIIADQFNEKNIPTRTGSSWSAMQVKRLIDRGAYQGV